MSMKLELENIKNFKCVVAVLLGVMIACSCGFSATQDDSQLDAVFTALKLTPGETRMLIAVSDGTPGCEESGFYMMMGKVAALPKLSPSGIAELEAPGYKNLMRSVSRFRYHPLRMPIRIYTITKLTVKNRRLSAHSKYWPIKKPMWEIFCTTADKTPDIQQNQPLILYSTAIPEGFFLDKGKKVGDDEWNFENGLPFDFAGVFYKVVSKADRATGKSRDYPVFLAWQIGKPLAATRPRSPDVITGLLIVLGLLIGGIAFMKLRRRIKREKNNSQSQKGPFFRNYTPLRDSDDDIEVDDKAIDPQLTKAAEEYRRNPLRGPLRGGY